MRKNWHTCYDCNRTGISYIYYYVPVSFFSLFNPLSRSNTRSTFTAAPPPCQSSYAVSLCVQFICVVWSATTLGISYKFITALYFIPLVSLNSQQHSWTGKWQYVLQFSVYWNILRHNLEGIIHLNILCLRRQQQKHFTRLIIISLNICSLRRDNIALYILCE